MLTHTGIDNGDVRFKLILGSICYFFVLWSDTCEKVKWLGASMPQTAASFETKNTLDNISHQQIKLE